MQAELPRVGDATMEDYAQSPILQWSDTSFSTTVALQATRSATADGDGEQQHKAAKRMGPQKK